MSDVNVCIHKHSRLGGILPQEVFRNYGCSEIVSEAILDRSSAVVATVEFLIIHC